MKHDDGTIPQTSYATAGALEPVSVRFPRVLYALMGEKVAVHEIDIQHENCIFRL